MKRLARLATLVFLFVVLGSLPAAAGRPTPGRSTPKPIANKYAVIVGISDYPGTYNDLQYCDDDATDLYNTLVSQAGYDPSYVRLITNDQATKGNVQDAIVNWLASREDSNSQVTFFYSGHGTSGADLAPVDEADGLDEYLCTYGDDYGQWIRDDELTDWLGVLDTTHLLVAIDSCYSGGMFKILSKPGFRAKVFGGTPPAAPLLADGISKDLDGRPGTVTLTASDDDESSIESDQQENGAFAYYLVEALRAPWVDNDSSDSISAEEAYAYLQPRVLVYGDHTPQMLDNFSGELTVTVPVADFDDNIPGRSPDATPVAGDLGRPDDINDTFSLDLAEGQRVTASLDATAGTDFDQYLFHDGTDIWTSGPVAAAEAEDYPERFYYVVPPGEGGAYYLDLYAYQGAAPYTLNLTIDTPIAPLAAFEARPLAGEAVLSWTGSPDPAFAVVKVLRSATGYAFDASDTVDQTVAYEGAETSHTDLPLANGTTYYYSAFAGSGSDTNWSVISQASATPYALSVGQPWLSSASPVHGRTFYIYGYLRPRHSGSTRLYLYRLVNGRYRYYDYRNATNYDYLTLTRFRLSMRMAHAGRWRVRAYHQDADHPATWGAYRYFTVR